ncbi:hypothetical protein GQ53DRAFT_838978 [Thozetella sp. PMI_491]|nr:hypothetical protein GQ53DRAFT_838978 [Thozetella sp. PMI_491]
MATPTVVVPRYLDPVPSAAPVGSEPQTVWLQNTAIAVEIVMPSLALIVCVLRAYIRILTKNIGWDDYCMFAAMSLTVLQTVGSVIYIKTGYVGIHSWEIPPHDGFLPGVWSYINGIVYHPILSLVKISVLLFLLRIASIKDNVRIAIWVLIGIFTAYMIAVALAVVFVCDPIAFNWDPSIKDARCFNKIAFVLGTSSITCFTALVTLAVPFWIFLSLRMARKAKIAVLVIFALGLIDAAVGFLRLYVFAQKWATPKGPDSTFSITYIISSIESNLAIIAASGPSLWPLARRWFPGLFSNLGLSRGYQGDIPDIETEVTSDNYAKMPDSRAGSVQDPSGKTGLGRKIRTALGLGGSRSRGETTTTPRDPSPAQYTTHTVGGTSFTLSDMSTERTRTARSG